MITRDAAGLQCVFIDNDIFRIAEAKGKLAAQAIPTQQELEERKEKRLRQLEEEQAKKRRHRFCLHSFLLLIETWRLKEMAGEDLLFVMTKETLTRKLPIDGKGDLKWRREPTELLKEKLKERDR